MKNKLFEILLFIALAMGIYTCWPKSERMSPPQFQQHLIDSGYPLPKYGADGKYGEETLDAWWDYYNERGEK